MSATPAAQAAPSAYAYPLLVKQLLITPIARGSTQEIVYGQHFRYGYPQLVERIHRLGSALSRLGVRHGDTVAVMDWDSHRYLECYFAIPMLGAVLQTVNVRLSPEQILYTLNHARASVLLVNSEFLPLLAPLLPELPHLRIFVQLQDPPPAAGAAMPPPAALEFAGEYEALLADGDAQHVFADFDENTRATTFYTTGTTGLPKGVFYSHRQLVLLAMATAATLGSAAQQGRLHVDDVYMPITPLFHVHAWGMPYTTTMLGLKQVYPGRYTPDGLLQLIRDEGVTFLHCVPTLLHMLLTHPASAGIDLSRTKFLIGGSALSQALAKAAMARGIDVYVGYGMSETGPIQTINQLSSAELAAVAGDPDAEAVLRTRTGRPALLCDVRVVDTEMQPRPRDGSSSGEVVFRSPWLTQGYLGDAQASEALWDGGWLHSGDIGVFSADGALRITDRVKDVIKTGGEWVSSLELEDLISQMPQVAEVAVVAVPDSRWGERPLAAIVPKPGMHASVHVEAVRAHLQPHVDSGRLSRYALVDSIVVLDALLKTSVGKFDKKALRQRLREEHTGR